MISSLPPLVGGGYWIALMQAFSTYFVGAAMLHWAVPSLLRVRSIQRGQPRRGQVAQEAINSLGKWWIEHRNRRKIEEGWTRQDP